MADLTLWEQALKDAEGMDTQEMAARGLLQAKAEAMREAEDLGHRPFPTIDGYLAALAERAAEYGAAARDQDRPQVSLENLPIPLGWKRVAYREPKFDEYFLCHVETHMGTRVGIGYQDGRVSFRGRQAEHIIVVRDEAAAKEGGGGCQ